MSTKETQLAFNETENKRLKLPGKETSTQPPKQIRNVLADLGNINLDNDNIKSKPSKNVTTLQKSGIPQSKTNLPTAKQGLLSKSSGTTCYISQLKKNPPIVKQGLVTKSHGFASISQLKTNPPVVKQGLVTKSYGSSTSIQGTNYTERLHPTLSQKYQSTDGYNEDEVSISKSSKQIRDVDRNDQRDIFLLGRYVTHIYKYLLDLEVKLPIEQDFLNGTLVTSNMRATLIDWLHDVQMHCRFLLETLHLAVSILDRYLQVSGIIHRRNFQLVGITAMLLACKFEEIHYPEISDIIYLTDNAYSKLQVIDLEKVIVRKLDFRLGRPISLTFLRRFGKVVEADQYLYTTAKYFIELALLETCLASSRPSQVAAAAIFIALCVKHNKVSADHWSPTLEYYSSYNLQDFLEVTTKLAMAILEAPNSKYQSIRNKYSQTENFKVSNAVGLRPDSAVLRKLCKLKLV
ncbi:G2/mitotic-specific cyclin-B2 isoform X2 [Halyomorpha halys]|uniref:G2/mitotic-specific cyclin-B2 isoform X2 n=1 Tax=Halyomorpha halys TaxID=286706 RepID=UPI000D0C8D48|nr:G2/mitotic-specific cyclin-B2-like isoform X2 [Halyomorpha halys]